MQRSVFVPAAVLLPLLLVAAAAPQTSNNAGGQSSDAQLAQYDQAMQAKDYPGAIALAQQMVAAKASSFNFKILGNAQLYAGTPDAALATYIQALAAAEKEKPAEGPTMAGWRDGVSHLYIAKGNALLKLKRTAEAIDAYNQSAEFALNRGLAYFNVCAVLYNNGNTHDSATACRKCVQADPTRANGWYVLASDLFADATYAKGKVIGTPEMIEALKKYMELAPDGPHAADVKAMQEMIAK